MKIRAAVLNELNAPLSMEELELDAPKAGEVLVKVLAAGLCHTDTNGIQGGAGPINPIVLGHEGAGIVEAVGEGVTEFKVGDKVAMTYATDGTCKYCKSGDTALCNMFFPLNFMGGAPLKTTRLSRQNTTIKNWFGQSSFATRTVVPANSCVRIPEGMDLNLAGPFGCGYITGAGTVFEFLKPQENDTFVLFGPGAVGFAGMMAAKICGCSNIIVVGRTPWKLDLAKELGATHIINSKDTPDVVAEIKKISPAGANCVLDTTGVPAIVSQACLCLGKKGRVAFAGLMKEKNPQVPLAAMMSNNATLGVFLEGDCCNREMMEKLFAYHMKGKFPVEKLTTYYDFEDINKAFDDLEHQKIIKAVVKM